MRYLALILAFGCGSKSGAGGDDVPPDVPAAGDDAPTGCTNPADCPGDTGTFVATQIGNDANPGTRAQPLKTITAGIAHAKALGGHQKVFVAQGSYAEKVTLAEGIDLNGSYECNSSACTWNRDLAQFAATIVNQDFEGILAGPGISGVTLVGGFTIRGKDGVPNAAPGSAGMTLAGGAPTIRGNKITGGTVTGGSVTGADRSLGIAMRGTGSNVATIENNDITAGSAVGLSAAISMEAPSGALSYASITANVLRAGSARRSDGIAAFGSGAATVIANNDITSGDSLNGASNGIEVTSKLIITGNRINIDPAVGTCMQAATWCAGITTNGATVTITNNVIYGPKGFRSAGVFMTETEIPAGAVILNGNFVSGGGSGGNGSGTLRNESAAVAVSIGTCQNCGLKGIVGRVRNNILDGGINLNRYGVREDPSQGRTSRLEVLEANDLWFDALPARNDTLYRQVTATGTPIDTKSIILLNQMTTPPASSNLNDDPQVDATWHIDPSSPCNDAGVATEAPGTDFDGQGRPTNGAFEIGADEVP